jgi:sec-independent protein translocase protein TatB
MFDFGFAEMLIVGIVALLVIGPERLPSVARKVGTYVARIRRFVSNVRSDVEREFRTDELQRMLKQQQDELNSLKDVVNETRQDVQLDDVKDAVEQSAAEIKDSLNDLDKVSDTSAVKPANKTTEEHPVP